MFKGKRKISDANMTSLPHWCSWPISCSSLSGVVSLLCSTVSQPLDLDLTELHWLSLHTVHFLRPAKKSSIISFTAPPDNVACLGTPVQIISALESVVSGSHISREDICTTGKWLGKKLMFSDESFFLRGKRSLSEALSLYIFSCTEPQPSHPPHRQYTSSLNCSPSGGCCVCFH